MFTYIQVLKELIEFWNCFGSVNTSPLRGQKPPSAHQTA
jgi:hypothetical protein